MASTNTSIERTDKTWNPVRGCRRVSPGCENYYAERLAYRFSGKGNAFEGLAKKVGNEPRWTGKVMLVEKELETPFKWRKPQRIFVNSVSDLFHEDVPFEFIESVFGTMAGADWHTYQILTKRPARMLEFFQARSGVYKKGQLIKFPLPNVWLGVSVESQKYADERIPLLLQAPAAVRFLSCEPLLGPLDLSYLLRTGCDRKKWCSFCDVGIGHLAINWIIAGGESGPNARPANPDWFRFLRDQCEQQDVPFFFKQFGEWSPVVIPYKENLQDIEEKADLLARNRFGSFDNGQFVGGLMQAAGKEVLVKVGKKAAGRELDGKQYNEFPEISTPIISH